ncbi:MAG: hypothetical protein A2528_02245 [Candidatus Staskawiczbacteria bacterium RIFOXYD2_FULL_37_9]|nr:MAG: hypothetical protein A2528_02245 [Candidatus Staskawiczbacteria bacterium RIFOXYD2_FULL_37_9]
MKVPAPTFCPICRFERRAASRNERKLFKNKNAFTGEDIFSLYPPESKRKVVTEEEWMGDSWDPTDYGRDIDWSRPFLEQILELEKKVPIYNLNVKLMVNSPYSGNATGLKNCYLLFSSNYTENCSYGNGIDFCKDCFDNSHINHSEMCYDSFWLKNCYQCYGTIMSVDCRNMYFSRDCLGCNDCLGCVNLRKSSYCIFNKQYTKEEYKKLFGEMCLSTIDGFYHVRQKSRDFWKTQINKNHQGVQNLNSTGSYVTNSKNVTESYFIREGENLKYCQIMQVPRNKDCYDCMVWGENIELSYETCVCGEGPYNLKFCFNCWPACRDSEYCINIFSSSDCFGCAGVKKAQYCILNKQYTKEEYEALIPKIKKHMDDVPYVDRKGNVYKYGEFFPIEFSPFGYNNSLAIQHFDMTKEKAESFGYEWVKVEKGNYNISLNSADLPQSIDDANDNILNEIIKCEKCQNAYRILRDEFSFYKKERLPLPTMCNECRHERRIKDRLGIKLYSYQCMCAGDKDDTGQNQNTVLHEHGHEHCGNNFKTGFDPELGNIVYCESCYQKEVA